MSEVPLRCGAVAGRVWLVGAGPGDPDLVTVRGRRLVETADAIVHDRLVAPELVAAARPDALRIDVGKMGHRPSTGQPEIERLLVRLARAGLDVVRLKGGDPFVFGRGGEEVEALRAAGIEVEVVPGVTAGLAGPAAAWIPVTHRGVARSVAFVTGHVAAAEAGRVTTGRDWSALAGVDTLVVYMAARAAAGIARSLVAAGRSPATPVAVVVDATLPGERVTRTDLGRLARADAAEVAPPGRPTLLVIGDVVRLAERLAPPAGRPGTGRSGRERPEPERPLARRRDRPRPAGVARAGATSAGATSAGPAPAGATRAGTARR